MEKNKIVISLVLVVLFAFTSAAMATAPAAPSGLASSTHSSGGSSTNNVITVTWTASADSALNGYATSWESSSDTLPWTKNHGPSATSSMSMSLADGSWYFVIRAVNNGGEYSELAYAGPFIIDTTPSVSSISPGSGETGTSVKITGTDFMSGASVNIGDTSVTTVVFVDSTELTATVPAGINPGTYDITVTNPNGKSAAKPDVFTVSSDNSTPEVEAGSEKTVMSGNAPSFSDATATDADEDDSLTYAWTVVSAPADATEDTDYTLTSESSLNGVTFTPTTAGAYSLKLTATDSYGAKGSDTVQVTVNTEGNTTPSANAGSDQAVVSETQVNLQGTVTDPDAGDEWTYEWTLSTFPSDSSASLIGSDTITPSFIPDKAGSYSISFVATDAADVASAADSVTITAYLSGDINGDNDVDLADVIVGLKVIAGDDDVVEIYLNRACTGKIGLAEVICIFGKI